MTREEILAILNNLYGEHNLGGSLYFISGVTWSLEDRTLSFDITIQPDHRQLAKLPQSPNWNGLLNGLGLGALTVAEFDPERVSSIHARLWVRFVG